MLGGVSASACCRTRRLIDLEANAAMRSIVRRDTEETYQESLTRLAKASGRKP